MVRVALVVGCAIGAACGRLDFGPVDPLGVTSDGTTGDGITNDGVADAAPELSCIGLAATCGPSATSSCCGSSLVPGGAFDRSYDVGTDNMFTDMTNAAMIADVRFDTYEITVGRFRKFVTAGTGTQAMPPSTGDGARMLNGSVQGGWDATWNASLTTNTAALVAAVSCDATYQSWTNSPGANEALPMNCITWFEAFAFCAWDGGFLPTESEWNYVAAGGNEQRAYPWSSPPSALVVDCAHANYNTCLNNPTGAVNRVGSESPLGDGKWGQADLGGNVYELTLDWYVASYPLPCDNCTQLAASTLRVIRGGDFFGPATPTRGAARSQQGPAIRSGSIGARCARAP